MSLFESTEDMVWRIAAAAAGAVVSLSLPGHRDLTPRGKFFTWLMGFLFAIFIGPMIVLHLFPDEPADSQLIGSLYFLVGMCGMAIIPAIVSKAQQFAETFGLGGKSRGAGEK